MGGKGLGRAALWGGAKKSSKMSATGAAGSHAGADQHGPGNNARTTADPCDDVFDRQTHGALHLTSATLFGRRPPPSTTLNIRRHWRDNSRGVESIVMNGVFGLLRVRGEFNCLWAAGLRIGLIERCAGAGDRYANPVAPAKDLAQPADVERQLVDLAGDEQRLVVETIAIASSQRIGSCPTAS